MNETPILIMAAVGGGFLGTFFFIGLWWTIQKASSSRHPALLFFFSLILRTSVVMVGIYFISHGDWKRLLFSLFGFIVARLVVTKFTQPGEKQVEITEKVNNAS